MADTKKLVEEQFEKWKNTKPNIIQSTTSFITKPIEILLEPFIKKAAPLLEDVLKGANNFISKALKNASDDFVDIASLNEDEFAKWLNAHDVIAKNCVTGGIAALSAEGAGTGLGGFALMAVDIPASFGLILLFANKIALTYSLNISTEEIQIQILQAIAAGSECSIEGKIECVVARKAVTHIITKQTWKTMEKSGAKTLPGLLVAIRAFLKKLGINVTKRKAMALIPLIGAASGAAINGSWAADALEAVRQYSRKSIVEAYYSTT